jgi:hypothetical protein
LRYFPPFWFVLQRKNWQPWSQYYTILYYDYASRQTHAFFSFWEGSNLILNLLKLPQDKEYRPDWRNFAQSVITGLRVHGFDFIRWGARDYFTRNFIVRLTCKLSSRSRLHGTHTYMSSKKASDKIYRRMMDKLSPNDYIEKLN